MASPTDPGDLEALLEYIRTSRGFDFTGYKRPSLRRRVEKRMQAVGCATFEAYGDYLQKQPDEFVELFNTILINVTTFFRDPQAWDYMRHEIVPSIVEESRSRDAIRIWATGCASGEEPYSIAICFAELLSEAEFAARVKIYATDVDEEALAEGRHGIYAASKLENVPDDLRERYFDRLEERWIVSSPLRRAVIFGRHDIVQDPPISRIDLLTSRNTLMYFTSETQQRILANFNFALRQSGYLFLGKSEMMLGRSPLFSPVELRRRVFRKVAHADGYAPMARPRLDGDGDSDGDGDGAHASMREANFETAPVAQLVVDHSGHLMLANLQARTLLNIAQRDLGKPLKDLAISYKPVELRSHIDKALAERHAIVLQDVEWSHDGGEKRMMDVQVGPLMARDDSLVGIAISFADTTRYKRLQEAVEQSKDRVETAYEELQSTMEELETTNEELQSTNEELETTNEELQSTNEELETMNEELQSTNEELETINDELNQRTGELNQTNFFLESILGSLEQGVVVLDQELRVAAWNDGARELWGLLPGEVDGQHFMNLDIGLPVDRLRSQLRSALAGDATGPVIVEATNRRGRTINCRVRVSPLSQAGSARLGGVILFMETDGS